MTFRGAWGLLGQVSDAPVAKAIEKVRAGCDAAKMPWGMFYGSVEPAAAAIKKGARLVAVGTDLMHMASATKTALQVLRQR